MVEVNKAADLYQAILGEVSKIVIGKEQIKESLLIAAHRGRPRANRGTARLCEDHPGEYLRQGIRRYF